MSISNIITKTVQKQLFDRKAELEGEAGQIDALMDVALGRTAPVPESVWLPPKPTKQKSPDAGAVTNQRVVKKRTRKTFAGGKTGPKPNSKKRQLRGGGTVTELAWSIIKKNPGLKMKEIMEKLKKADPGTAGSSLSAPFKRLREAGRLTVRGQERDYKYYAK